MDKLKEYLRRHQAELDVDAPASDAWENISSKMAAEHRAWGWRVRYVAAACMIVLAGVGLWLVISRKAPPADTVKQTKTINVPDTGNQRIVTEPQVKDIVRDAPPPKRTRRVVRSRKPTEPADAIEVIDKSYASLIDLQLKKLRATPLYAESGSYFSFYVDQFKQMDQDEQRVRNDIKRYGLTNEFLEQLINVYQQKLNLLKNLETEINKMNNKVREKAAPSAKTEVYYLNI